MDMKNIVSITLVVLFVLLAGVIYKSYSSTTLSDLPNYLPQNITSIQPYTLFQYDPLPTERTIRIGATEETEEEFIVVSTQGQYLSSDRRLAMTISVEELNEKQYEVYKEKVWERYTEPSRGGSAEKHTIRDREVFLSFREIGEGEDTSSMVIMGGGYIFFPENRVVLTYSIYNPRLYACEDNMNPETCSYDAEKELPTMENDKSIAEQILDHYFNE